MAHVWNILNTIQIVNTFPLFSLNVPENVNQVLISFNNIANLQIIPKEEVYNFIDKLFAPDPLPEEFIGKYEHWVQNEELIEASQESIVEEIDQPLDGDTEDTEVLEDEEGSELLEKVDDDEQLSKK